MGTTFSAPVYSDGIDRARRDPAQMQQGFHFLEALRRNPPGQWGADRWEQVNHYTGIIYVAVRRIVSLFAGATYTAVRRKRARRGRVTFGPGGAVAKAVGASSRAGRDDEYTPIDDPEHPLARVVARPNDHESFGRLTAKGVLQYHLTGVYPLWVVPNAAGRPVQLYALRTPFLYPLAQLSRQYPNGAWRVTASGMGWMSTLPAGAAGGAVLPGEEVRRMMNPHPIVDYDGYSPLTACGAQLDVLQAIDESRKSAMDNGLNLDAVMLVPGADQEQLNRLSAQMTEKAGGSRNHRKFVALATLGTGADKTALETLGTAPKDMDYQSGWEQHVKFALANFGVPPAVAGLTPTGGNAELFAARRQFHDQQDGTLGESEEFYTAAVARPFDSFPGEYRVQAKFKPVDDHEFREQQVKRRIDADLVTYNEARAMDDADPVEDGDVPVSIYLDTLKQKLAPPPQPAPGIPPEGGGKPPPLPGATPTGGAPPGEDLPEAEGTRPPLAKAMSALTLSGGGALVPDGGAAVAGKRKKGRKCRPGLSRFLRRELKALGG